MLTVTRVRHAFPEPAGFVINRESGHEDHTFLHFFGSVDLLVGGEIITTKPHACIVYPAGEPQYFLSKTALTHDWIHFCGDIDDFLGIGDLRDTVFYPEKPELITKITRDIEAEFNSNLTHFERVMNLKLEELFIMLKRSLSGELLPTLEKETKEVLRSLRAEMFMSLSHPWNASELAKRACLSQSRFFLLYKSLFGISPMRDLILARMDAAKNALATSDIRICELSESLGYSNVTHFVRQFGTFCGTSPTAYRNATRH